MTAKRDTNLKDTLTQEQAKRKAVVTKMLSEREQRQRVSHEEIRRMRSEGRH